MKKPTDDQVNIAILWLYDNEGEGEEGEACRSVAQWLSERLENGYLRKSAREAGVPVKLLRSKLRV